MAERRTYSSSNHTIIMRSESMPGPAKGKSKKKTGKYAKVTHAQLCKQVEDLTKWTRVLKGMTGLGGWTYAEAVKAHRPDGRGGPTDFP